MGSNNSNWNNLLDERQGGKKDFFVESRFIFYTASLIAFVTFLIWLEFDYGLLETMYKSLESKFR